jgi:hypothetical protein
MIFCKDDEIKIWTDEFPQTRVRTILATYSEEQKKTLKIIGTI